MMMLVNSKCVHQLRSQSAIQLSRRIESEAAAIEMDGEPMSQLEANLLHIFIFNMTGNPAGTIPIGSTSDELPIGVQVVGRCWQEMALLDVATMISSVGDGYQDPPG